MEERIYNCKVITPMFLGGANGKTAELRAPSVKGVLRYWWRAMHGNLQIEKLHEKEAMLFGSSYSKYQQRSKINIRVYHNCIAINDKFSQSINVFDIKSKNKDCSILNYLAFGPYDMKEGMKRFYFPFKSKFQIIINYDQSLSDDEIEDVEAALYLTSFIGGLGSKTRNGFGKFIIEEFNYDINIVKDIIGKFKLADYTAFSKKTKIFKLKNSYNNWEETLTQLGNLYRKFRLSLDKKNEVFKRELLAAPIIKNENRVSFLERHAKPYFLSVIPNNNKYDGYIFCIPYNYPNNLHRNLNNQKYQEVINEFNGKLEEVMETIL